jgi:hypothetical protein
MAKAKKQDQEAKIVSYKGFDPDFKCRDFQFEVGKTYKVEGKIKACENGFHACENPFDVWSYYEILNGDAKPNRFAIVEQSGDIDRHAEDSKIASAKITIKAELKLPEFVRAAVQWVIDATKGRGDNPSGDYARIGSSGDSAQIGSSGHYARIGSSGHSAQIGSSGHSALIKSEGNKAVIASAGRATVSAKEGTWVSIAEFNERYECVGFATGCIGKDGLKPDTAYIAKGGKLVEAGDQ